MRFEKLPGLPPYGPLPRAYGGPQHSEGLVVRFWTATGDTWVGNFHGRDGRAEGVLDHPDKRRVVVLARGEGYVVNPDIPDDVATFGYGGYNKFFPLPEFNAILFVDDLGVEAINEDGLWWRTPRISWDEIRHVRIERNRLYGEASMPGNEEWVPFSVDLRTGDCKDGVYEATMRRARLAYRPK